MFFCFFSSNFSASQRGADICAHLFEQEIVVNRICSFTEMHICMLACTVNSNVRSGNRSFLKRIPPTSCSLQQSEGEGDIHV